MFKKELIHFFIMPTLIGIIGGFSAILFRKMINFFSYFFNYIDTAHTPYLYLVTMPILFFISNLLISKFLIDQSNVTIDNVAKRVALMAGKFSHTRGILVLILSSMSLGAGASVGREGPIAKLGGLTSELFLKAIKAKKIDMPIYLSAGVSSAIAATFNAPIAGIIFGLEIIIGKVNSYIVIPLIISCSLATVISDHFLGEFTAFYVPSLPYEEKYFIFVPLIALFISLLAILLIKILRRVNKVRIKYGSKWKYISLILGFFVGLVIVFIPEVKGVGYNFVSDIFTSGYGSVDSLLITISKIVVVSLSIGGGIFGGLMSPSIFIGAFGGYWLGTFWFSFGIEPRIFALIGSASMLAGVSKAPLRATIIVTELTHSYELLLLMLMSSAITGYILSKFEVGSYFKRCLIQKGIDLEHNLVDEFFSSLHIDKYIQKIPPITPSMEIKRLQKLFKKYKIKYFPVVNKDKKLIGVVSFRDVRKRYLVKGKQHNYVHEIMSKDPFSISEDYTKEDIFKAFSAIDANFIPYTDNDEKYLGMISLDKLLQQISFLEHHYDIDDRPKNL